MSNWGLGGTCLLERSSEITVTTGSTGSLFGSYVELFGAVPRGVEGIFVHITGSSSTFRTLLRFAIGAAGSEVEIATDIPVTFNTASTCHTTFLPLRVPVGARLSVRALSNSTLATRTLFVELMGAGGLHPIGCSKIVAYGHTSGAAGTSVTAGASGTFGTSVQLVASTPHNARMFGISMLGQQNNVALRGTVATFAGASSIEIAPRVNVEFAQSDNNSNPMLRPILFPCHIAKGTDIRVAVANYLASNPVRGAFVILGY